MTKSSNIDLAMTNKKQFITPLDYGLSDIITADHSCSVIFWLKQLIAPRVEALTITDLLTYCICHYADILKSFQIDYRQEKKNVQFTFGETDLIA